MNCSSCGKPLSQSGSLTQWLGLGDFCKCQILFESDQGTSKNFDAICTYCGLHLNKNTGSITQWAFRRQTCNCLPALKKSLEPSKIALENIDDNSRRKPGEVIGEHYEIISFIGEGGASAVYRVRHRLLDKELAVKILLTNRVPNSQMIKRFQQEGRSIGRLKHTGIVAVHEFNLDKNQQPFLVMDLLEGKTLAELIEETDGLPPIRAAAIFQQITEALEHAHEHSVIHRDLKPNNVVILTGENGEDVVKLVDFGIAKLEEDVSSQNTLTKTGEIFGSPQYMSPEQCKGRELDARADLYSFGCLMYETLTGAPAANAETVFDILMQHINGLKIDMDATDCGITMRELAQLKKGDAALQYKCFNGLKQIIAGCIQPTPEERYDSITAVKKDLILVRGGNAPQGKKPTNSSLAQKYLAKRLLKPPSASEEINFIRMYLQALLVCVFAVFLIGRFGPKVESEISRKRISFYNPYVDTMGDVAKNLEKEKNKPIDAPEGSATVSQTQPIEKERTEVSNKSEEAKYFFPVERAPVRQFRNAYEPWAVLSYGDEKIYVRIPYFKNAELPRLDAFGCDSYLIRASDFDSKTFKILGSLKHIKHLYLCNCKNVTAEGIEKLAGSKSLKSIHLQNMTITSDWVSALRRLPVAAISFKDSVLTQKLLDEIESASHIKYLNVETLDKAQEKSVRPGQNWLKQTASDGNIWYCRRKP